jgi:hypothetical protein
MGVTGPPIWVENLLKNPPEVYSNRLPLVDALADVLDALYVWSQEERGAILVPKEMPLPERRFTIACVLFSSITKDLVERMKGLTKLLVPDLLEYANYFARVFLAPDPLVVAYRKQGKTLSNFANTFIIPEPVALERWEDPILPVGSLSDSSTLPGFSLS